jgi:hypothetical protein
VLAFFQLMPQTDLDVFGGGRNCVRGILGRGHVRHLGCSQYCGSGLVSIRNG